MYTSKQLRLNTFKDVNVPKPRDYVQRYGLAGVPESSYTGDETAPIGQSKIDAIMEIDRLNLDALNRESAKRGE